MTNKTRKHIWPGALVMSIAIVGFLAAFVVLANNPGAAMAHEDADHAAACEALTDAERARHDAAASALGQETCGTATSPIQQAQPSGWRRAGLLRRGGSGFRGSNQRQTTSPTRAGGEDEDGNATRLSTWQVHGSELVTVFFDVVNTAQGDVDCLPDRQCLPDEYRWRLASWTGCGNRRLTLCHHDGRGGGISSGSTSCRPRCRTAPDVGISAHWC